MVRCVVTSTLDDSVTLVSIGDVVEHRLDELETEADILRDAFLASH